MESLALRNYLNKQIENSSLESKKAINPVPTPPTAQGNIWVNLKDYFSPPTALGLAIRKLAIPHTEAGEEQNLETTVCQAFDSPEFPHLKNDLLKIFDRLKDSQLDSLLTQLFAHVGEDDPRLLVSRLLGLFSLKKVEAAIQSKFPHFKNTLETSAQIAKKERKRYANRKLEQRKNLEGLATHYVKSFIKSLISQFGVSQLFQFNPHGDAYSQMLCKLLILQNFFKIFQKAILLLNSYVKDSYLTATITILTTLLAALLGYRGSHLLTESQSLPPIFLNLVDEARLGRISPVYGRDAEIDQLIRDLCAHNSTSLKHSLLKGMTRVGKTEIVKGLALRIAAGNVPDELKDLNVYMANCVDLFPKTLDKIPQSCRQDIFFFDEFHAAFSSTTGKKGGPPVSQKFKTMLDPGPNRLKHCIFATTNEEFFKFIASDSAIVDRLNPYDIHPLSGDQVLAVLEEMGKDEASDLIVKHAALEKLAGLDKVEGFEKCSQPSKAKSIFAKAIVRVRQFNFKEAEKALLDLKNKKLGLESQYGSSYGEKLFPYTDGEITRDQELDQLNVDISALEEHLSKAKGIVTSFTQLVKKTNEVKERLQIEAIRIADNGGSDKVLTSFILQFHYYQKALHDQIQERLKNPSDTEKLLHPMISKLLENDVKQKPLINVELIEKLIQEEMLARQSKESASSA